MSTDPIRLRLAMQPGESLIVVDAWPITSGGAEDLALCVHRSADRCGWTVSDRLTGLKLYTAHDRHQAILECLADLQARAAERDASVRAVLDQRRAEWTDLFQPCQLGGEVDA